MNRRLPSRENATSARAVPAAAVTQVRDNYLRLAARLQVSVFVREANHRIVVGHINPLRITYPPDRTRCRKAGRDSLRKSGFPPAIPRRPRAQNADAVWTRFRDKNIAVRATRINRGFESPLANKRTVNPGGTDRAALEGCLTTCGAFPAESVLNGGGTFCGGDMVFDSRGGMLPGITIRFNRSPRYLLHAVGRVTPAGIFNVER